MKSLQLAKYSRSGEYVPSIPSDRDDHETSSSGERVSTFLRAILVNVRQFFICISLLSTALLYLAHSGSLTPSKSRDGFKQD